MSRELSIDRLDSLPDEVICHILSFLPTRLSMSTSVLAKRWRFLWAHVPVWDFEGNFKKGLETPNLDVIYSVIQRHKVKTIHSLRLSIGCYESQLNTLISTTLERNIRNLHIDLGVNNIVFLHRTLFTCKTVVEMRLDNGLCLPSTGGACLPSLKKLHLSKVDYEDDNALTYLLSGCPLLQELIIDHSADETDMRFFHVVSSTIKMLEVNCQIDSGYPVQILTIVPELRSLRVVDCDFAIPIYMASLVELDIHFKCLDFGFGNNDNSNAVPFFNRLSNISCLKLSSCEYLKVIDRFGLFGGSSIKFNNLTKLELQLGVEWHLLVEFLEVADNLEVLVADVKIHNSCMEPKQVPKCLLSSLKTITIKQQGFEEHELDLVRYLLRNSQVLERMEILPRKVRSTSSSSGFLKNDLTAAFKAFERISLFEPGSKACQLAFFSDCGVIEIVE